MPHEAADDSTVAHGGASVVAAPPLLPPLPASGSAACATAAAADPPSSSSSAAAAAASCCCWLLDVSRWRPAPGELEWLAEHAVVDAREAASALAHRQPLDRARAIAARLMARACSARALGLAWEELRIERTRGRRPYCANGSGDATSGGADSSINNSISTNHTNRPPNFNFNAAHEGDFVALASDALCAVGVDVAAPRQLRRRPAGGGEAPGGIMASLRLVKDALTLREWAAVEAALAAGGEAAAEAAFQRRWAAKEACVKATGEGLGFAPLSRVEVVALRPLAGSGGGGSDGASSKSADWNSGSSSAAGVAAAEALAAAEEAQADALEAIIAVDGRPLPSSQWRVALRRLPRGHWLAAARAPPAAVVDALGGFKATFARPDPTAAELEAHHRAAAALPPPLELLTVGDLLPPRLAAAYEELFAPH